MTKAEIVNQVAQSTGVQKDQVLAAVDGFMEAVKDSLAKGEPVYLRGFGSFIIKHRAEKTARNITKEVTITIPAHDIPALKPSKAFVGHIKNLYVCQCSVVVCSNTDKMSLSVGAATGSNIWSMIVPLPKRNLRRFVRGKFDVFFVI